MESCKDSINYLQCEIVIKNEPIDNNKTAENYVASISSTEYIIEERVECCKIETDIKTEDVDYSNLEKNDPLDVSENKTGNYFRRFRSCILSS